MPTVRRQFRRIPLALTALLMALALVPAAASAHKHTYGSTALVPNAETFKALEKLGVTPGIIPPASSQSDGINFPITNPIGSALFTGTIRHSGGLTLSAGKPGHETVVRLAHFWINLESATLSAEVSVKGGPNLGRVDILNLDFSNAHFGAGPVVTIGPLTATLTSGAAKVLNEVFKTEALSDKTVLGAATVKYSLKRHGDGYGQQPSQPRHH